MMKDKYRTFKDGKAGSDDHKQGFIDSLIDLFLAANRFAKISIIAVVVLTFWVPFFVIKQVFPVSDEKIVAYEAQIEKQEAQIKEQKAQIEKQEAQIEKQEAQIKEQEAQTDSLKRSQFTVTVTGDPVNIRSLPSASSESEILGKAKNGDKFRARSLRDGFYEIIYNGKEAYIHESLTDNGVNHGNINTTEPGR